MYLHFISIQVLFELYRHHTEEIDRMNRNTFREFLHNVFKMTDDILMDRIFKYFDTLNNGLITREEWILGLNIFLRGERCKLKQNDKLDNVPLCETQPGKNWVVNMNF